jgi:hypothetical protein
MPVILSELWSILYRIKLPLWTMVPPQPQVPTYSLLMMHVKAGIGSTDQQIDARAGVLYCCALFGREKHACFHYLRDYFGYKLLCMLLELFFPCILDQFFLYYTNKCSSLTMAYCTPWQSYNLPKRVWSRFDHLYATDAVYLLVQWRNHCYVWYDT